jgi:AmmeMemoRadiSam system protein A
VGYLVARLFDSGVDAAGSRPGLVSAARDAVESWVKYRLLPGFPERRDDGGRSSAVQKGSGEAEGVFVTLWKREPQGGQRLRGCIGSFERRFKTLEQEVADCAIRSATEDPRFTAVRPDELSLLEYEISLLSKPQEILGPEQLDARTYGVIMSDGKRSATLLPGIDGIDTVEQQLAAVRRKAGIASGAEVSLQRYSVVKVT